MPRKPIIPSLTPEQTDGYLAAAFELCGNVACRIRGRSHFPRVAFASADRALLERIQAIVDGGGRIYSTPGSKTYRLEYYRREIIAGIIGRVRRLVGDRKLEQIEEFEATDAVA